MAQYWPNRTWFPELMLLRDSHSLADSFEEGSAFSETRHPLAPTSGPVETPRVVTGWDAEVLGDLSQEEALTITSALAPSTRWACALKWNLFVEWCSSHHEDPGYVRSEPCFPFCNKGLGVGCPPPPLRFMLLLFLLTITPVEGKSVGKHNLVVRFLRGARRLNPLMPPSLPSWYLASVLRGLQTAPFELLQSFEFLSMKTLLLTALASIKRVGTCRHFLLTNRALSLGRPVQH